MNLANRITLGRLLLAIVLFVLMVFLEPDGPNFGWWLLASMLLFIVVVSTDALDGYYARKYGQVSAFGRVADPAVDKIVVCGTLIFLAAEPWARPVLTPWMVVVIVSREFIINALRGYIETLGIDFGADWSGKLKMIVQSCAIPSVYFFKLIEVLVPDYGGWVHDGARYLSVFLVWAALLLTVYSGVEYILKASRLLKANV